MELSEYKSGNRVNYYHESMNPDNDVYPGSVLEVFKEDGEWIVTVKLDCKNVICTIKVNEPGYIKLTGDL